MLKLSKANRPQKATSLLLMASSLYGFSYLTNKTQANNLDPFIIEVTDPASIITLDKQISGNGTLQKEGPGTLYLAEDNTYLGGTNIINGKLILTKSHELTTPPEDSTGADSANDKGSLGQAYYWDNDNSQVKRYDVYIGKSGITSDGNGNIFTPTLAVPGTTDIIPGTSTNETAYTLTFPHNITIESSLSNISVGSGSTLTFDGILSSSSDYQFNKKGAGNLVLTGKNTSLACTANINEGTLTIKDNESIGDQSANGSRCNITLGQYGEDSSTSGTLNVMAYGTFNNNIELNYDSSIETNNDVTINGMIGGAILTKKGTGKLTLGGNNTLTQGITIEDGTLSIKEINNIVDNTFNASYTLKFNGSNPTLEITDNVCLSTYASINFSSNGTINVASNSTFEHSGPLLNSNNSSFTKSGPGIFNLLGDNTGFSGNVNIADGTLAVSASNAIGDQSGTVGSITLQGILSNANSVISLKNDIILQQDAEIHTPVTLLTLSGTISGSDLTKSGSNEAILSGANEYTGKTIINDGTLTISAANNLGATPENPNDNNAVVIKPNAKLKISSGTFSLGRIIQFSN